MLAARTRLRHIIRRVLISSYGPSGFSALRSNRDTLFLVGLGLARNRVFRQDEPRKELEPPEARIANAYAIIRWLALPFFSSF